MRPLDNNSIIYSIDGNSLVCGKMAFENYLFAVVHNMRGYVWGTSGYSSGGVVLYTERVCDGVDEILWLKNWLINNVINVTFEFTVTTRNVCYIDKQHTLTIHFKFFEVEHESTL